MIKKDLISILDEKIKECTTSIQEDILNVENTIKKSVDIILLKSILDAVYKEKAFNIKINNDTFKEGLTETIDEISSGIHSHFSVLIDVEKTLAEKAIKEVIENSRNKKNKKK